MRSRRHARVPISRALHRGDPHDAGGRRPRAGDARDAPRRCDPRRDGGLVDRALARSRPRGAVLRCGVHEPDPGSPRFSRNHGCVRRSEGEALPRLGPRDLGDLRRRRVRSHSRRSSRSVERASPFDPRSRSGARRRSGELPRRCRRRFRADEARALGSRHRGDGEDAEGRRRAHEPARRGAQRREPGRDARDRPCTLARPRPRLRRARDREGRSGAARAMRWPGRRRRRPRRLRAHSRRARARARRAARRVVGPRGVRVRLRWRPGSDQARPDGAGCGGARGLRVDHQRQPSERGSGGDRPADHRNGEQYQNGTACRRARPRSCHRARHHGCSPRRHDPHRRQGPRGLSNRRRGEAPFRRPRGSAACARSA